MVARSGCRKLEKWGARNGCRKLEKVREEVIGVGSGCIK